MEGQFTVKTDDTTTIVFSGKENKKKLDEILWLLIQNFEERVKAG